MVARRKKLLEYVAKKDEKEHKTIIEKLGIGK
jgi:ribosomal protein S15P/S13E